MQFKVSSELHARASWSLLPVMDGEKNEEAAEEE